MAPPSAESRSTFIACAAGARPTTRAVRKQLPKANAITWRSTGTSTAVATPPEPGDAVAFPPGEGSAVPYRRSWFHAVEDLVPVLAIAGWLRPRPEASSPAADLMLTIAPAAGGLARVGDIHATPAISPGS